VDLKPGNKSNATSTDTCRKPQSQLISQVGGAAVCLCRILLNYSRVLAPGHSFAFLQFATCHRGPLILGLCKFACHLLTSGFARIAKLSIQTLLFALFWPRRDRRIFAYFCEFFNWIKVPFLTEGRGGGDFLYTITFKCHQFHFSNLHQWFSLVAIIYANTIVHWHAPRLLIDWLIGVGKRRTAIFPN